MINKIEDVGCILCNRTTIGLTEMGFLLNEKKIKFFIDHEVSWLCEAVKVCYDAAFKKLVSRMQNVIDHQGDFVEN
jgi:hypothetical protein